ncbi:response regulator transcription factor [Paenarthrobacter nicotinovorans]|jgi:DNA-binding NarL/FixJ family response regulator|uniref:response regulator transcription factor n=1 Tax=Paenarthrobacter nicotinovorans TaxID=29320 RepID=UPI003D66DC06
MWKLIIYTAFHPQRQRYMGSSFVLAGVIDDHESAMVGLLGGINRYATLGDPPVKLMRMETTVDAFLRADRGVCQVVALDMQLADGSSVANNTARLVAAGYKVLVFSAGVDVRHLQQALANGALGVSLKSEPLLETIDKLRRVAAGETIASLDLAAAIETDVAFVETSLSDREAECLALYATGYGLGQVATKMGVKESTVKKFVARIREKYEEADRPAGTKVDLLKRAVEDGILPPILPLVKE